MTTNEETITVDETVAAEEPTKLDKIKPIAKKVLIWTGAALGVIAGVVLLGKATSNKDEIDVYVIEESPAAPVDEETPVTVTAD